MAKSKKPSAAKSRFELDNFNNRIIPNYKFDNYVLLKSCPTKVYSTRNQYTVGR